MGLVAGLLLLVTIGGLPHLWLDDDTACPPSLQGSYADGRESPGTVDVAPVDHRAHCAVCHWIRTARTVRAGAVAGAVHVAARPFLSVVTCAAPTAPGLQKLPARAPPSTLL